MTVTTRISAGLAGGLLTIGLMTTPVGATRPSAERSPSECSRENHGAVVSALARGEHGPSTGTQDLAPSDPDGDTNGGADRPGCPGGIDQSDQDANNGCGNDADFEDDNNGNCGGAPVEEPADTDAPEETDSEGTDDQTPDDADENDDAEENEDPVQDDDAEESDDAVQGDGTQDDVTDDEGDQIGAPEEESDGGLLDVEADVQSGGIALGGLLAGLSAFARVLLRI